MPTLTTFSRWTGAVQPFATLRRWAADARAWQLDALTSLAALDDACRDHMAHGAMAGADPLTDSLYGQLEGPAAEGAQAPTPYAEGVHQGEHPGWWLAGVALLAALVGATLLAPGAI